MFGYFSVIADEVTNRLSNSEVLLLCLRYVTFLNEKPKMCETFFDSLHIQGRPSGLQIALHFLKLYFIFAKKKRYQYLKLPCTSIQRCKRNEQWQMWHCISLWERATISEHLSTFCLSPSFSSLWNLSNHWWLNCKNATKTYTQHTKWLDDWQCFKGIEELQRWHW